MSSQVATLLFAVGIAGLFWLDRDKSIRTSKALWLPVIWVSINGSRSVSAWLGMGPGPEIAGQAPPVSLLDQAIAGGLMLLGAVVLLYRWRDAVAVLKASWPIVLYVSFALVSVSWSDFPGWGFKRWVRALGDVIMVLIVVTDAQPTAALRRLFSRVGFVLLPVSVLLIKYYPELGRAFSPWGDGVLNTGVTTDKNMLGVLVLVVALGTLWQVLELLGDKKQPNRARRLLAQGILLCFGIFLLFTAHSATSGASFVLAAGLMLAITRPFFRARPAAVHAFVVAALLAGSLAVLLGGEAEAARAMGRKPDLTGRTEVWRMVIPMCPNPVGGAGFETFWRGPRVARFFAMHGGATMTNEAHNGYIEMYLNLGWIGLGLIALILGHGYRKAVNAFRRDSALGAMLLAYVVMAVAYNIGEAGFRMLDVAWIFLLLAIVAANRVVTLAQTASITAQELADPAPLVRRHGHLPLTAEPMICKKVPRT
jgi:exopolysaccharide production protein ExoQ